MEFAKMLTLDMRGKMEGFNCLTTSCKSNYFCQKGIEQAIKIIRNHSKEASDILDRYLLPSKDKRHISCKKCVEMLEEIGCPVCVCLFCYADRAQSYQDGARKKFQANGEYLKDLHEPDELPDVFAPFIDDIYPFRFESEGDSLGVPHDRNYIRISNKPQHSHISFALWTKLPEFLWKAVQLENGKPKNIQFVLSSRYVNHPDINLFEKYNILCMDKYGYSLFDKLFTVWTERGIANSGFSFNCCGSEGNKDRKCKNCLNCYKDHDYNIYVNELLR